MLPRSMHEVVIYLEQCLFMYELIPLIKKNGGKLKVNGEKFLIYDDLAIIGISSYISLPIRNKVQASEVFLILWKYLLILSKSKYL